MAKYIVVGIAMNISSPIALPSSAPSSRQRGRGKALTTSEPGMAGQDATVASSKHNELQGSAPAVLW